MSPKDEERYNCLFIMRLTGAYGHCFDLKKEVITPAVFAQFASY